MAARISLVCYDEIDHSNVSVEATFNDNAGAVACMRRLAEFIDRDGVVRVGMMNLKDAGVFADCLQAQVRVTEAW